MKLHREGFDSNRKCATDCQLFCQFDHRHRSYLWPLGLVYKNSLLITYFMISSHVLSPLGCVHLLVSFHVRVYQHPRLLADPSCLFHRLDLPHVKTTDQAHDQP